MREVHCEDATIAGWRVTSGERMVWAAEFVRNRGSAGVAARKAAAAVAELREIGQSVGSLLTDVERAMLDDVLSTGADR